MKVTIGESDYFVKFTHIPREFRAWQPRRPKPGASFRKTYRSIYDLGSTLCEIFRGVKGCKIEDMFKTASGTAKTHPDNFFVKSVGRKIALAKALTGEIKEQPVFSKTDKARFWEAYFKLLNSPSRPKEWDGPANLVRDGEVASACATFSKIHRLNKTVQAELGTLLMATYVKGQKDKGE